MRLKLALATFALATTANAQIAVIDNKNLSVAKENAQNTNSIMESNKDILEKSTEILKALSGSRTGNLGIGAQGLGGSMSVASAPSLGSILNGGALSFGGLSGDVQKIAGAVINGLQLVKTLQNLKNGGNSSLNNAWSGSVNVAALLSALTTQASQGVTTREQSLQSATGQIGQAEDVKGSVDENTRMQLETARAVNEVISVNNAAVSALNEDLKAKLLRQSQVQKMMTTTKVNPFEGFGQ